MDQVVTEPAESHHFAGPMTGFIIRYVETHEPDLLEFVLRAAGETRSPGALADPATWSSYDQTRRLMESTARALQGLATLRAAGEASLDNLVAPEIVEMVRSVGSPEAFLERFPVSSDALAPVMEMNARRVGDQEWSVRFRIKDGFEPFPELCAYMTGIVGCIPKVFGYSQIDLQHDECQVDGSPFCRLMLRWSDEGKADSRSEEAFESRLFQARLNALQTTVGELVSGEGLDTVLPRIVAAAGRAVHAPRFLLSLENSSASRRLYPSGMDESAARQLIERLDRQPDRAHPNVLIAEVESRRARYGRLVAMRKSGDRFNSFEASLLQTYAGLAAASLDSALAVDEARRQAGANRALLDLSASLVELDTTDNLAARLAEAVPSVIDCDRAVVVLFEGELPDTWRIGAVGYDEAAVTEIRTLMAESPLSRVAETLLWHDPARPVTKADVAAGHCGAILAVTFMMRVGGELLGSITADVTERPDRLLGSQDLADRLQGLAGYAAVAFKNARLLEQTRYQSLHDPLTGLANRSLLGDRVEQALAGRKLSRKAMAIILLDLDDFKRVNDLLGHEAGDRLLQEVATRLVGCVRSNDTVARLGGDEFAILLDEGVDEAVVGTVCERMLEALAFDLVHPDGDMRVGASVGVVWAKPWMTSGDLLRSADVAMYAAKSRGKHQMAEFEDGMTLSGRFHA